MSKRTKETDDVVQQELTKKQERLRQKERQQHRTLFLGVGIAVGAALLFVILGLVSQFMLRPNRAVATVGDQEVVAKDFWKRVRLEKGNLENAVAFYQLREQQFGNQGIFTQQINQLQATLASPFAIGQQTLDQMIEEIILKREAEARGITVSDEEVNQALREEVASSQGLVTQAQATATVEGWANATATASAWTPTPEPTANAALTETAALTPTATPEPLPMPVVISDTAFTQGLATLEESVKEVSGMSIADYSEVIRMRLLREKLQAAIGEDQVAPVEEQVRARHILIAERQPTPTATALPEGAPTPEPTLTPTPLPAGAPTPTATPGPRTREEALALAADLRQQLAGGADFAALAAEYSDDPGSRVEGGELGWFGRGAMVAPFEEAAFSLPVGQVSEPISTTFGVHLVEVEEKDAERAKDEATLEQERAASFQTWLQEQVAAANVVRNDVAGNLPSELQ
jgi:parvulin-like peptidyl-prolyl isomerase